MMFKSTALNSQIVCFALVIFISSVSDLHAADRGTRKEAISMVKTVKQMFFKKGAEATFNAVTSRKFQDRDLYPFIIGMDGVEAAHGVLKALNGKNILNMQDADGRYLIKDFINVVKAKGKGWVDYKWPNPVTGKVDKKSSYLERINSEYFVGVGIYLGTE